MSPVKLKSCRKMVMKSITEVKVTQHTRESAVEELVTWNGNMVNAVLKLTMWDSPKYEHHQCVLCP